MLDAYLQAIYDGLGMNGPILDSGRVDHTATIRAFKINPSLTPEAAHTAWVERKGGRRVDFRAVVRSPGPDAASDQALERSAAARTAG